MTKNLDGAISEAIDDMISNCCLTADDCGNSATTRKSQAAKELGFDENEEDGDQWLKVSGNLPSVGISLLFII